MYVRTAPRRVRFEKNTRRALYEFGGKKIKMKIAGITTNARLFVWTGAVLVLVCAGAPGLAQSGGPYTLQWSTLDGGGGTSTGGPYTLTGTTGQPDAGAMSGHKFELLGGFWTGGPLCIVDFEQFAGFAEYWLHSGGESPADLDGDLDVDSADLERFVIEWLYPCPYNWPLR